MERLAKTDIKFLPGVGPRRAELLGKELDIHSFYDLLYYFPFRYIDRSTIHKISDLQGEMPYIQLHGRFVSFNPQGQGAKRRLNALFTDGTGTIEVVWRTITRERNIFSLANPLFIRAITTWRIPRSTPTSPKL